MRNKIANIFALLFALVAISGCTLDITRDHLRVSILRDTSSQRTTVTTPEGSVTVRGTQTAISGPALQAAISGAGQIFLHAFGL